MRGLLLALLVCAPLPAGAEVIDRVVAVVNDEIVTLSELEDQMTPYLRQLDGIADPVARAQQRDKQLRRGLDELVGARLISQEGVKHKLTVTAADIDAHIARVKGQQGWSDDEFRLYLGGQGVTEPQFRRQVREQLLRRTVIRRVLGDRVRITDADVEDYYKSKMTREAAHFEIEAAQILLTLPEPALPADVAAAEQQARELVARVKAGESFGALADQYSQAANKAPGGYLGFLRRGVLDAEFEDAAFSVADGEVGGPFRTRFGVHLIQAISRKKLPLPDYESIKEELRRELTDKRLGDEVDRWVQELKDKAFVEIRL